MATLKAFVKAPGAVLDFAEDWSAWLRPGETIVDASWVLSGVTEAAITTPPTDDTITIWLEGGTVGETATAECTIQTSEERTDTRTIAIRIERR